MYQFHLYCSVLWADFLNVALECLEYLRRLLVRDQPHADFALRGGGYDCLRSLAREAADYAVGVEGGARPDALQDREAGFAHERRGAYLFLAIFFFVEGQG